MALYDVMLHINCLCIGKLIPIERSVFKCYGSFVLSGCKEVSEKMHFGDYSRTVHPHLSLFNQTFERECTLS